MKYTKEDLVYFAYHNSNAPITVLKKSSIESLEAFIKKGGAWDLFINNLEKDRELRILEKTVNQKRKELGF